MKLSKVKKVTVQETTIENKVEFEKKACSAIAKVLSEKYSVEVLENIIEVLKEQSL